MTRALLAAFVLLAAVASTATAQDVFQEGTTITVELMNGDKLTGILLDADGPRLVIQHDVFGRMEIPRAAIRPVKPEEPEPAESPWSGSIDLALTGAGGNTENQNFRTSIELRHDDEDALDVTSFLFLRSEAENSTTGQVETTSEKAFAQHRHEWKLQDSKWRPFVQASYEKDQFTDYDARAAVAGGVAYPCLEGDVHELTSRLGAGVSHKYGTDDPTVDETTYEALVGWDYFWTISELSRFSFISDVYPSIDQSGEFRSISKVAWETKVGETGDWFFKAGLDTFYDSQAGAGTSGTDNTYYLGLGRSF
jgi:hypothetical protein